MVWKKLNDCVDILAKPVLGTEDQKDGKRYMALCVDPSSKNPYIGIARQVLERTGHEDVPGYSDKSKLVLVESDDLLNWKVVKDLEIKGLQIIIDKLKRGEREFIGLEDPDILVERNGRKHVYFTIPFEYNKKFITDIEGHDFYNGHDVYVGHAQGNSLENLTASEPVLGRFSEEIVGFKEICPTFFGEQQKGFVLAETFVNRSRERRYSAIGLTNAKGLSGKWDYIKLVHDPEKETKTWCAGHSSPCRIFNPNFLKHQKYLVGIMNGREPTKDLSGEKIYGKFRPGLFLFDNNSGEIVWIADNPLFEDPLATTITFASDLVCLNKDEAILYAHPNDSFVRAYKINVSRMADLLPHL